MGKRGGGPKRRWTPEEDEQLHELAGRLGITRIAARLGRSVSSVSSRSGKLGISHAPDGFSLNELTMVIGTTDYRIIRTWVESGLLAGERNPGRGRWGQFLVTEEALVAFLKTNPHLVDRQKVDLVYQQYVDERWITLGEAFRRGAAHVLSLEHAYLAGLLPEARRRGLRIVIPERVLPLLVEGRRQRISDPAHRRQWTTYANTAYRRRPIRKQQFEAKQHFDPDPIVARLLKHGRLRDAELFEEAVS